MLAGPCEAQAARAGTIQRCAVQWSPDTLSKLTGISSSTHITIIALRVDGRRYRHTVDSVHRIFGDAFGRIRADYWSALTAPITITNIILCTQIVIVTRGPCGRMQRGTDTAVLLKKRD